MPPKKKEAEAPKILLGRPSNNVQIGLVGLPNVGKSTLFNLFGGLQVPAENFPFCTIEPAKTTVAVPDPRFTHLCEAWKPKSQVPAVLHVTDIAGLVKGAAEGKGLGNAFLSNIQSVDAIYHVTRAFEDKTIEHVEGDVNPTRDFEIIRGELIQKDAEWVGKALERLQKAMRAKATKEQKVEEETLLKAQEMLKEGKEIRHGDWKAGDVDTINGLNLLTAKSVVYLVNISTKSFTTQQNKFFKAIKDWVAANSPGDPVIPYSATFEQKLQECKDEESRKKFLEEAKVPSMMDKIIVAGFKALNLVNFFTTGEDEVRAWTIRAQTPAPRAASVIHTDFEKNFICALVYNYTHFKECGADEKKVKEAGHYREQGKTYIVQDGDIMLIRENSKKK